MLPFDTFMDRMHYNELELTAVDWNLGCDICYDKFKWGGPAIPACEGSCNCDKCIEGSDNQMTCADRQEHCDAAQRRANEKPFDKQKCDAFALVWEKRVVVAAEAGTCNCKQCAEGANQRTCATGKDACDAAERRANETPFDRQNCVDSGLVWEKQR